MAPESESISPLSVAEVAQVRDNVKYLHGRYPGETDFTDVLRAVVATAEGEAPELPEDLHPVLEKLRLQTRDEIAHWCDDMEQHVRLNNAVKVHTSPAAIRTAEHGMEGTLHETPPTKDTPSLF